MKTRVVCLLILSGLLSPFVHAQQYRSTLTGQITDTQGAGIPNAKIVATSVQTGAESSTVSGPAGEFTLPYLAPGAYTVTAESQGFERYVNERVILTADTHVTLNIAMTVGASTESVTVTAEASMLDNSSASIGQAIPANHLLAMPSIGRAPMGMAKQAYGVIDTTNPAANSRPFDTAGTSRYQMGGGSGADANGYNELLLDGSPNMWAPQNREVAYNPPLDAVEEVKSEVFSPDAGYGDTLGGTIQIVTKGGTEHYHGDAEEYDSPSALTAAPYFISAGNFRKLASTYNEYGFTLSGPLYIPKVLPFKHKVFFLFSYEGIHDTAQQPIITTVPTAAMRNGDFSALLTLGSIYTIYDPATAVVSGSQVMRQPFQGNIIPTTRLNSVALAYQAYYPLPNLPSNATGINDYLANTTERDAYFTVTPRVDIVLSDRHKLFADYHGVYRTQYIDDLFGNVATGDTLPTNGNGATVDDLYTINPSMVLNTRISWTRLVQSEYRDSALANFNPTTLGFPSSIAAASPKLTMPYLSFSDSTQPLAFARSNVQGAGYVLPYDNYQAYASLTKVLGTHAIKVGVDLRKSVQSTIDYANSAGSYSFTPNWVNGPLGNAPVPAQGLDYAQFLLGLPTGGEFDLDAHSTAHNYYAGYFLQDDWRAKPNLTLNLGLRYEHVTPVVVNGDRALDGFNFTATNSATGPAEAAYAVHPISQIPVSQFQPLGGATYASSAHPGISSTYDWAFSPRFGFSYTPAGTSGKTVIRGGFGVFFGNAGVVGATDGNHLETPLGAYSQSTPVVPTNNGYLTPYATLSNPFPAGIQQPAGAAAGVNTYLGQTLTFINPQLAASYSERWTLTVQRQIASTIILEVGYIGNYALHIPVTVSLDGIPAQFLASGNVRNQTVINAISANVTNPFQGLLPGTTLNGSTTTAGQLLEPYPEFAGTSGLTEAQADIGRSNFNALEVRLDKRFSHGLELIASYERSKLLSAVVQLNPSTTALTYMIDSTDRPNRLVFSGLYELPFGRGKAFGSGANRWVNGVIGGWKISGVETLQQAAPLAFGNVIYLGGPFDLNAHKPTHAFNTAVFNTNASQQLADNIRTFPEYHSNLREDAIEDLDSAITKTMPVKENYNLVFRGEAFNTFNHVQFGPPNVSPTSTAFGTITTQVNSPRTIQLSVRLEF